MEKKAAPAGISNARLLSADGIKTYVKQHLGSALFRNAYYLMGSYVATSILSFVFWLVAARFYTTEAIGIAGAIISMISFIAGLADLGISTGIIRFLPNAGDRANRMMNTGFSIQVLASVVASGIFLAGLKLWSPAMLTLQTNFLYIIGFILLALMNVYTAQLKSVFTASSKSRLVMIADIVNRVVAIPTLFMLASLSGFFGVLGAQAAGFVVTIVLCLTIFLPRLKEGYHPRPEIDKGIAREIMPFSLGNYLAQIVGSVQLWLLPTIILNILGAKMNAFFYIGLSISTAVWMVPTSIATSAFVESSHFEDNMDLHLRKSLKLAMILDAIAVAVVFFFGELILGLFGKQYASEGIIMIRLLAVSVFPMTIGSIIITWARITKHIRFLIIYHVALAVVDISLVVLFAPLWQLTGVGIAFLLGNTAVVAGAFLWFKIRPKGSKLKNGK